VLIRKLWPRRPSREPQTPGCRRCPPPEARSSLLLPIPLTIALRPNSIMKQGARGATAGRTTPLRRDSRRSFTAQGDGGVDARCPVGRDPRRECGCHHQY